MRDTGYWSRRDHDLVLRVVPGRSRLGRIPEQTQAEAPVDVDVETGEVFELDGNAPPAITFAEITDGMQKAANLKELDDLADLARSFDDEQDKQILREAYKDAKARIEK